MYTLSAMCVRCYPQWSTEARFHGFPYGCSPTDIPSARRDAARVRGTRRWEHPRTLYARRNAGELKRLGWGVYRLAKLPPLSDPDLATVAKRVPPGVVCLNSALAYHELATQIPHEVQLALPRTARSPVLTHPPLRVFCFSPAALSAGIERREIDSVSVRIYGPEKTLADCFKFRNTIGLDVALETRRAYPCANS